MANSNQKPHAIFIPYPLQGHVIPSVHLAIKLASKGFTISFINTQFIHHQILKSQSKTNTIADDIFVESRKLGLDINYYTVSDGLPIDFDRSINHDQFMASLLHLFSAHVEDIVRKIIIKSSTTASPVNCMIADTFFVWPSMISKKLGLSYVSFWTEPALVYSLYYHMDLLRKHGHFASSDNREDAITYIPGVPAIEPVDMMSYLQDTDTSMIVHEIIFKAFDDVRGADFVICNTVQELEPETISALQVKKPFFAIGPIFPSGFTKTSVATSLWPESDCTQWLNTKPKGSVLYISFGSYAHINKNDLIEIAHGLLQSKVNFVFVLRPDVVSVDDPNPLPEGFSEESNDRGILIQWCCQVQVLSHPAVGGFLTHCGWNSILESIWCSVPMLCFPLLTDQFTNRKLVVDDWKIGLNIGRKQITRKEVSEKIIRLMDEKSGYEFRKEIVEVKKALENASKNDVSSEKNLSQFVNELKVLIGNKSKK
ncbi:UDP-glycosyltransferase 86A2 [Papaver somniferum]|uniref:UDP-glycosyltransferase 86A2 n=1 Tax=Papaver somniferum TaxID=3469 RepID=UPI000E702AA7|nr:UDP-glycosyltransferase 86A2 [Papaver somniferum]